MTRYHNVNGVDVPFTAEEEAERDAEEAAVAAAAPRNAILAQIAALEATVTQRRLREAMRGVDGGWLANVDALIATLRAQL